MIEAVLFDLDGTLVDTPRAIVRTFTGAFAELGLPVVDPDAIRATIGIPLERAFGDLIGARADGPLVRDCVRSYQELFRTRVLPAAPELVYPGVAAGLDRLAAAGTALAVATSKHHASADALLTAAGLRDRFAVVVGADEVSRPKPDPETAELILRRLGVAAEHAVVVGDTVHDLAMAAAGGLRSVAVTYGVQQVDQLRAAGPTWLAGTFEDVLDRLGMPARQEEGERGADRRAGAAG